MTDFHNVTFPFPTDARISAAVNAPARILTRADGAEYRLARGAVGRIYDIDYKKLSRKEFSELAVFYIARQGARFSFLFRDPHDFSSAFRGETVTPTDQIIGVGDGATTGFQLKKTYGTESAIISHPVTSAVRAAVNGVETINFTLDPLTGRINFNTAPPSGETVTAGVEFLRKVRFSEEAIRFHNLSVFTGETRILRLIEVKD